MTAQSHAPAERPHQSPGRDPDVTRRNPAFWRREQALRRYLIALTAFVFVMATGIGGALAGGSSDTSGDGYHCYLFFSFPDGTFAQAMVNDSYSDEVLKKVEEFYAKYVDVEGGWLDLAMGNVDDTWCAPYESPDAVGGGLSGSDCQLGERRCMNGQCIDGRDYCEEDLLLPQ